MHLVNNTIVVDNGDDLMVEVDGIQRRQYYRLKYPKKARPVMSVENQQFQICESSERGLRILMNNIANLYSGLRLSGTVRLHSDQEISIEGSILRFDNDEVIVKLDKGLSFRDMVSEQRHIRQKYPSFFA
jgi:c-di-GMP-binding flagellar brake protein YcgR